MTFSQFKEILLSVTQDSQTVVIPDDMSASTKINELPLDSIHIVELSMEIEAVVGKYVDSDLLFEDVTIGQLLEKF
jgi:acyl carrier protein